MLAAGARRGLSTLRSKTVSSLASKFIRSSTFSSTIPPEHNTEEKNTLYLCFARNTIDDKATPKTWCNLVRPIKLDSYNDEEVVECKDAIYGPIDECFIDPSTRYSSYEEIENYQCDTVCTRFGSRILFHNKEEDGDQSLIFWVDPTIHSPEFQVSSPISQKSQIPSLSNPTSGVHSWGEIDQNLYCIHGNTGRKFEVLESDPENDVMNWRPLIHPQEGRYITFLVYEEFLFLNRSKKILHWCYRKSGMYVFDVKASEKGWTESDQPTLRDTIPFLLRGGQTLVIEDLHHPILGNFNLVLDLVNSDGIEYNRAVVFPFLLSENCDKFQTINNPIHLPPEIDIRWTDFVNLGDKKFCLVVHNPRNDTSLVLTYEYDVIVSSNNVLEIQTRLLGTRRFQYPSSKDDGCSHLDFLVGAYLL